MAARRAAKVQWRFQKKLLVTATHEGADRGGDVVDVEGAGEEGEDDEVDQVAGAADDAEFGQLPPARRAAGGRPDADG